MDRKFRKTDYPIEWLGGVCSGFAYYMGCPIWIVRILFSISILIAPALISVMFLAVYILLWIFLPKWKGNPKDFYKVTGD